MKLEEQIRKLQQQANLLRNVKHKNSAEWKDPERQQHTSVKTQLEGINKKIVMKEKRFKMWREIVKQYNQNRTVRNNEIKFYKLVWVEERKTSQQPNAKETEQFWKKTWKLKEYSMEANG